MVAVMQCLDQLGLPHLFVNDGMLDQDQISLLRPTDLTVGVQEMRRCLDEDGYLFLKGLLPRDDVLAARKRYFESVSCTGLLKPGSQPVEGIFDLSKSADDFPGIGTGLQGTGTDVSKKFIDLALQAHKEPWYKDTLCQHPILKQLVQNLTGWGDDTLGLERTLLRNNLPGNAAIGVHYDYIFLRHGNDSVLTCWVPIGDVKVEGGGLIYLENGHQLGHEIEKDFTERALATGMSEEEAKYAFNKNMMSGGVLTQGAKAFANEHQRRWLVSSYEAGDVVIHNSYMIHASTVNHDSSGVIRLATDLRFVDTRQPWDERWAKVYEENDGL